MFKFLKHPVFIDIVVAVLFISGVSVLSYPSASEWFRVLDNKAVFEAHSETLEVPGGEKEREEVKRAQDYNERNASLSPSINVSGNIPVGGDPGEDYNSILSQDGSGFMGKVVVPSVGIDLPIYHGTNPDILEKGVGHLEGTAFPVGGNGTRSVLTGHRGLASAELFTNLPDVQIGDEIKVISFGNVVTYKVFEIKTVEPDQGQELRPEAGRDLMTLVTCTPLGINSQRVLVTGERVTPDPVFNAKDFANKEPGFPWWAVWIGGTTVLSVGYVVVSGARRHRSGATRV